MKFTTKMKKRKCFDSNNLGDVILRSEFLVKIWLIFKIFFKYHNFGTFLRKTVHIISLSRLNLSYSADKSIFTFLKCIKLLQLMMTVAWKCACYVLEKLIL